MIILTVTDPGGAGKTTTASLVVEGLQSLGHQPKLGEMEGSERARFSRLAESLGYKTLDLKIKPASPEEIRNDPRLAQTQFKLLFSTIEKGEKEHWVIDMAALLSRPFFQVAKAASHGEDCEEGRYLTFIVPTKAGDADRNEQARETIRAAREVYPKAQIIVVINMGAHDPREQNRLEDELLLTGTADSLLEQITAVLHIPLERSSLTGALFERRDIAHGVIRKLSAANIGAATGMERLEVKLEMSLHAEWYRTVMSTIERLLSTLIVPQAPTPQDDG